MKLFLFLAFSLFLPDTDQKIFPLDQHNFNCQYDLNAEVQAQLQIARYHDEATVFIALHIPAKSALNNYDISLHLADSYKAERALASYPLGMAEEVDPVNSVYFFKQSVRKVGRGKFVMLVVQSIDSGETFYYDVAIPQEPVADLLLFQEGKEYPVFDPFIGNKTPVIVKSWYEPVQNIHMFTYFNEFEAAESPMDLYKKDRTTGKLSPRHLNLRLSPKAFSFDEAGLYLLQKDSSKRQGLSFLVIDHAFPKYDQMEQLLGPVTYLSSKKEYQVIQTADHTKREFDRYWITAASSTERARKAIRSYYQHVAEANLIFTTYKAGWKTDQGMVYTLLGKPDGVYRDDEKEIWIYKESEDMSEIKFIFAKVNNLFTSRHYQLVRSEKYAPHWHRVVNLWRKGKRK